MSRNKSSFHYYILDLKESDYRNAGIDIYNSCKHVVNKFMVNRFNLTPKNYVWCVAGGLPTFLTGKTTDYGDIDVFVVCNKDLESLHFTFDIPRSERILHIYVGAPEFVRDKKLSYLNNVCNILAQFDLNICRHALIDNGKKILAGYIDCDDLLIVLDKFKDKYRRRINLNFQQDEKIKWRFKNLEYELFFYF